MLPVNGLVSCIHDFAPWHKPLSTHRGHGRWRGLAQDRSGPHIQSPRKRRLHQASSGLLTSGCRALRARSGSLPHMMKASSGPNTPSQGMLTSGRRAWRARQASLRDPQACPTRVKVGYLLGSSSSRCPRQTTCGQRPVTAGWLLTPCLHLICCRWQSRSCPLPTIITGKVGAARWTSVLPGKKKAESGRGIMHGQQDEAHTALSCMCTKIGGRYEPRQIS